MKSETPQFPILLNRPGTRKEIAERIVRWHFHLSDDEKLSKMHGHGTLVDAIEAALNAERERCAKIADRKADTLRKAAHVVQQPTEEALRMAELAIVSVEDVAREIRGTQ